MVKAPVLSKPIKKKAARKPARKSAQKAKWTVYIVRCCDDSFYTGYTGNMEQRLAAHNGGKGAKYTASRRPVELVYTEKFTDRFEAMKREYRIKCLTRAKKRGLIDGGPQKAAPAALKKPKRSQQ